MGLQLGSNSIYAKEKGLITSAQFAVLQQVRLVMHALLTLHPDVKSLTATNRTFNHNPAETVILL